MLACCASFLLALPSLDVPEVFVVDAAGAGDFTDLQTAVFTARDGDVLLIRSGTYAPTEIVGKTLSLIGDEGATVVVEELLVRDLTSNESVVIGGLTLDAAYLSPAEAPLIVEDCDGPVLVERATIDGETLLTPFTSGTTGAIVRSSAAVTFVDCTLLGASGLAALAAPDGKAGLRIENSSVHVFGGHIEGGVGRPHVTSFEALESGGDGGDALRALGGELTLVGTVLIGGDAGDGASVGIGTLSVLCTNGGNGGAGLVSDGTRVTQRELSASGGSAGIGGDPAASQSPCIDGVEGAGLLVQGGSTSTLAGPTRALQISPSPIREGQTATIRFTGAPGDAVLWALSVSPSQPPLPDLGGPILVAPAPLLIVPGVVPPDGELELAVTLGPLSPTLAVVGLFEQALHVSTSFELVASNPRHVVHLDAAY